MEASDLKVFDTKKKKKKEEKNDFQNFVAISTFKPGVPSARQIERKLSCLIGPGGTFPFILFYIFWLHVPCFGTTALTLLHPGTPSSCTRAADSFR